MLVVLAGGEGDVAFEGAEGAGGGARRGKRQGEQEEKAMVAHDLALFGLLRGFHGQLEKWANFGLTVGGWRNPWSDPGRWFIPCSVTPAFRDPGILRDPGYSEAVDFEG